MFRKAYDLICAEISGDKARNLAEAVWINDRGSSFDGHYRTARLCEQELRQAGAQAELVGFPADGATQYGTMVLQKAWDCRSAALELLEPEAKRLTQYPEQHFSCVQGSPPTPPEGLEGEVVIVKGGGVARDYRGLNVAGKFVLTDGYVGSVHAEAAKAGALGVLSDAMATNPVVRKDPLDLPDAQLWQVMRPIGQLPAFVLSPRQGKWLRALIEKQSNAGQAVRLRARVDSRVYDGQLEMVSGLLRGKAEQEVALIAHYAEPGANDNASGVGLCLEAMRALNALISSGKLPRPRRGIRVWLTHEFSTLQAHAYSHPAQMERVIAALNCDMVGEDMGKCGSTLMYQDAPDACPSFVNHLMRRMFEHFRRGFYVWGNMSSDQAYFPALETAYWGNDNFISDPSIGIPSVAFINWPDKYYHTSEDTADKLSAETLARVGALAAAFAYTLANAGKADAICLAEMVAAQAPPLFETEVTLQAQKVREALPAKDASLSDLNERLAHGLSRLDFLGQREQAALQSVHVLLTAAEREQVSARLDELAEEIEVARTTARRRYQRLVEDLARSHGLAEPQQPPAMPPTRAEREAQQTVPRRLLIGIVNTDKFSKEAKAILARATKDGMPARLLFWIDGQRDLLEAGRLAALEDDRTPPAARRLVQWYQAMKLGGVLE